MPKYVFVTGGVMSGLGKGVTTAAIAKLLQLSGFKVTCAKIDPYINVDAGTMNPITHGEVFVTDDGGEADMDLGTYERFLNQDLTIENNITTGQVYQKVINDEREGKFLGKCVQIIPHVTDEIKKRISDLAAHSHVDVIIVECGGTVGDMEGLPFLEAFRQMRMEEGLDNTLFIHVTLAPVINPVGEVKTKPTQHSVQELRRIGIQPDIIVVRGEELLTDETKKKISLFTSVESWKIISDPNLDSIYKIPECLELGGVLKPIFEQFQIVRKKFEVDRWSRIATSFTVVRPEIKIAIVGKYTNLSDSYASVNHALSHAGAMQGIDVQIDWLDAEEFEKNHKHLESLGNYHGILTPGGFGDRGSEGKILVANYTREKRIPYLGICFGFQLSVVAYARYVCGLDGANSIELDPSTPHPVVHLLPEQRDVKDVGATMRLGGHDITLVGDTIAFKLYGQMLIRRRHRHRYEFNQEYKDVLDEYGMVISAFSDGGRRAEIMEIPSHPFYLATQYHPEFTSRPGKPEEVYLAFVQAAAARRVNSKGP